jgi:hypothetical protein
MLPDLISHYCRSSLPKTAFCVSPLPCLRSREFYCLLYCNALLFHQVIAINKQFPGPIMNVTTNYNVVVNVLNSLDEPLLITWSGSPFHR